MDRILVLFCLAVALAGCAPTPSSTPTAAPLPYLAITPALQPWFEARASAYVSEEGALDFFPLLRQPNKIQDALRSGEALLAIAGTGPPAEGFITPLGEERIAIVVHPENPVDSLFTIEVVGIFSGRIDNWDQLGGESQLIQVYIPLPGDEARELFASQMLEGAQFTTNAILAPSPHAMLGAVAEDQGAIGLLPLSAVDDTVRLVSLDGVSPHPSEPSSNEYPLRLGVLAFAPQEPVGALRTWLGWVQAKELGAPQD